VWQWPLRSHITGNDHSDTLLRLSDMLQGGNDHSDRPETRILSSLAFATNILSSPYISMHVREPRSEHRKGRNLVKEDDPTPPRALSCNETLHRHLDVVTLQHLADGVALDQRKSHFKHFSYPRVNRHLLELCICVDFERCRPLSKLAGQRWRVGVAVFLVRRKLGDGGVVFVLHEPPG